MNMMNSVIIEGKLSESRKFLDRMEFDIETSRMMKNSKCEAVEEKDIFTIETFGKISEVLERFETGRQIRVVGRLASRKWMDLEREEHRRTIVVAEHVEIKPVK